MDRAEQELDVLEQISQILGEGGELSAVYGRVMAILQQKLRVQRGALVLLDRATEQLRTIASVGLTPAEQERGRYAKGEGITGRVLATGQTAVVPDVSKEPQFLDRTGARSLREKGTGNREQGTGKKRTEPQPLPEVDPIPDPRSPNPAFICVPIKDAGETVGTMSVDLPYKDAEALALDARLLRIVAGSISQALRAHQTQQVEKERWLEEREALTSNLRTKYRFDNIIGSSPVMLDVLATIAQVASSRATVLILGETGCGKELIAKAIHYNSPRRDKPLVRVNCGALSPQLLESELFGHVKGAFTGAIRDKIGRFEAADGSTLFLDEVGTLDPQLQVKLLRVLQEREFERVGDHKTRKVNVRVIAATNLDLEEEVRKENFREDLYYRLNVVTVHLPALRARREDIPPLIDHFLDRYNKENGRSLKKLSRDTLNTLLRYPWPGNVRELENAIERAVVLSTSDDFTEELLPLQIRLFHQQIRSDPTDESIEAITAKLAEQAVEQYAMYDGKVYSLVIDEVERQLIREALAHHDSVKIRTADFLGINRNTLNKKVKDLGIEVGE